MTQNNVDADFLDGLNLIINSLVKENTDSTESITDTIVLKDDVDHWCPDAQAWHTADHQPTSPPS